MQSCTMVMPSETQGWCQDKYGQNIVFRDKQDPDYQAILRAVQAAKARQEKAGRYDMQRYHPNEHYVRWMKRFGILPEDFDLAKDPIDPCATDRAYWRSLWYRPPAAATAVVAPDLPAGRYPVAGGLYAHGSSASPSRK